MAKRNYMAIEVFVGSAGDSDENICFGNDTLDGEWGLVKVFVKASDSKEEDKILGYFNAIDLMAAINAAANANISYLGEQLAEDKKNNKSEF